MSSLAGFVVALDPRNVLPVEVQGVGVTAVGSVNGEPVTGREVLVLLCPVIPDPEGEPVRFALTLENPEAVAVLLEQIKTAARLAFRMGN